MSLKNNHVRNTCLLGKPFLVSVSLALSSMVAYFVGATVQPDMAYLPYAALFTVVFSVASFPLGQMWLARAVEYDRLANELLRNDARSVLSPKIDKLFKHFYATRSRQLVLALAVSCLPQGPSEEDSKAWAYGVFKKRSKRLPLAKLLSKEWFKATFFPTNI